METLEQQAIQEALALTKSVQLDLSRDVVLPGKLGSAAVLLSAPRQPDGKFALTVRFTGPGNLDVNWAGIGVRLDEITGKGKGDWWPRSTGRDGQVSFSARVSKHFKSMLLRASRATTVGVFPRITQDFSRRKEQVELPRHKVASADGRLIVDARMVAGGKIQVTAEALSQELANADVSYEYAGAEKSEHFDGKLSRRINGNPAGFFEFLPKLREAGALRITVFHP